MTEDAANGVGEENVAQDGEPTFAELPALTIQLPKSPNFMCIDGKTFLVDQVDVAPVDMLKNVQAYYQNDIDVLKERVACHVSDESQRDLDAQVRRIERHLAYGVVALPEDARTNGTTFILYDNKVFKSKVVLFRPSRISCTLSYVATNILSWIDRDISRRDAERYTKFCDWARPLIAEKVAARVDMSAIKIDLMVEQDVTIVPMVVALSGDLLLAQPVGVHCHCFMGGNMCTGNVTASVFYNDPAFLDNFNSINPHSFANSAAPVASKFKTMLRNQYFLEGRIRNQEVTPWRI